MTTSIRQIAEVGWIIKQIALGTLCEHTAGTHLSPVNGPATKTITGMDT